MDIHAADLEQRDASRGVGYDEFKDILQTYAVNFRKQEGRFYVLLSLDEAEHLRSVLHQRVGVCLTKSTMLPMGGSNQPLPEGSPANTMATLWSLNDDSAFLLGSNIRNLSPVTGRQHRAMISSYRFVNSGMYFDDNSLMQLFRILHNNKCEEREAWWNDVRACRRRVQIPMDGSIPIGKLFSIADEYVFLEFKAVIQRIRLGLQEKGMYVFDAFRAFNSSNTGLLTCSELYGATEWLGIPFNPNQIYDLVKRIGIDHYGLVSYEDFKRAFLGVEDDIESRGVSAHSFGVVPPKPIPEIYESKKVGDFRTAIHNLCALN
jgi:hypothetical protein